MALYSRRAQKMDIGEVLTEVKKTVEWKDKLFR